jgi:hypothetical protein
MSLTITQQLGRPPTFPELQELAKQHEVQIDGNAQTGDFQHPDREHPRVKGRYTFEPNGDIRGEFTSQIIGKLAGRFVFATGQAEVTITEKPFLIPESVLRSKLSEALNVFCAKFPPAA